MRRVVFLLWLSASGVGACEEAARKEAQSLEVAVARFHRAENHEKPAAAAALRAVTCSAPDVCSARDGCQKAADAYAEAMVLTDEVKRGLARLEDGTLPKESTEARALVTKRETAARRLDEAQALLPTCDTEIQGLKRRYRF